MSRPRRQNAVGFFANWIGGHWSTILKFCIPVFLVTTSTSFGLGMLVSNLSNTLDKIKSERECNDRINAEIDKNRLLQNELTKKSTENLLKATVGPSSTEKK